MITLQNDFFERVRRMEILTLLSHLLPKPLVQSPLEFGSDIIIPTPSKQKKRKFKLATNSYFLATKNQCHPLCYLWDSVQTQNN